MYKCNFDKDDKKILDITCFHIGNIKKVIKLITNK